MTKLIKKQESLPNERPCKYLGVTAKAKCCPPCGGLQTKPKIDSAPVSNPGSGRTSRRLKPDHNSEGVYIRV